VAAADGTILTAQLTAVSCYARGVAFAAAYGPASASSAAASRPAPGWVASPRQPVTIDTPDDRGIPHGTLAVRKVTSAGPMAALTGPANSYLGR
jgi:hypothetical protein